MSRRTRNIPHIVEPWASDEENEKSVKGRRIEASFEVEINMLWVYAAIFIAAVWAAYYF